jgi:hypothetical protein
MPPLPPQAPKPTGVSKEQKINHPGRVEAQLPVIPKA